MKKKNVIFIGANGAGKSSLTQKLYHKGYHTFKLSPLANDSTVSFTIAMNKNSVVFDRWSPIDLAIYRKEEHLLQEVIEYRDQINDNNIIFYLENFNEYDESNNDLRIVQRPKYADLFKHIRLYRNYVMVLRDAGLKIFHRHGGSDADKTLESIERIIRENE